MKKLQINKNILKFLPYFYVIVFPLFVYLTFEILNTSSETFVKPEIFSNLQIIILSSLAMLLVMMIIFSLTGNIFVSGVAVTVFVGFFYVLSYYWLIIKGWVFSPSELGLISKSKGIVNFSDISIYPILYQTAFLLIIEMALLFFVSKKIKLDLRKRMVCLNVYLGTVLFLFCTSFSINNILPKFNIDVKNKAPINQTYRSNGVLLGFYTSYFYLQDETPADYTEDKVAALVDEIVKKTEPPVIEPEIKPNVIVIMSEAFFDPTVLPNITYTNEPTSNLHSLQKSSTNGSLLVPVFGGSTCNTEYEFLTGNAMAFIANGIIPYENEDKFIPDKEIYSLPNMFKDNGYRTASVHPYTRDFFNRNSIHPKLGFDKSIFLEDMVDPPIKGSFVSDEYFTDTILDVINETDEPLFLYGISMENHYYFDPGKFQEYDVNCESDRLNEFQIGSVDAYAQGVYDADEQLGRLIEEISKSGRPTIVVFFGDHLPLLGKSAFEVYDALDYIEGVEMKSWSDEDMFKIFTTPYIVWNNYGLEKDDWGNISPYFLGALVAKQSGIKLNYYYEFLLQAHDDYHGMNYNLFIDADNNLSAKPTSPAEQIVQNLQALQYDKIFGEHYADGALEVTNN